MEIPPQRTSGVRDESSWPYTLRRQHKRPWVSTGDLGRPADPLAVVAASWHFTKLVFKRNMKRSESHGEVLRRPTRPRELGALCLGLVARGGRWHLPAGLFERGPGAELLVPWRARKVTLWRELRARNPSLPLFAQTRGFFRLKGLNP